MSIDGHSTRGATPSFATTRAMTEEECTEDTQGGGSGKLIRATGTLDHVLAMDMAELNALMLMLHHMQIPIQLQQTVKAQGEDMYCNKIL
jgi:uncharacterized membrane-anchored protein